MTRPKWVVWRLANIPNLIAVCVFFQTLENSVISVKFVLSFELCCKSAFLRVLFLSYPHTLLKKNNEWGPTHAFPFMVLTQKYNLLSQQRPSTCIFWYVIYNLV